MAEGISSPVPHLQGICPKAEVAPGLMVCRCPCTSARPGEYHPGPEAWGPTSSPDRIAVRFGEQSCPPGVGRAELSELFPPPPPPCGSCGLWGGTCPPAPDPCANIHSASPSWPPFSPAAVSGTVRLVLASNADR